MFFAKNHSLKKRLIIILILSSVIPLILIGYISYISIYSLLNNNIESGIQSNLKQINTSLESTFGTLEDSSLYLAIDNDRITQNLKAYTATDDLMLKYELKKEIGENVALVNTINSNLGLILFLSDKKNEVILGNNSIKKDFDFGNIPVLTNIGSLKYHILHVSAQNGSGDLVFSVSRNVRLDSDELLDIYMEMKFQPFEKLLESQQYDLKVSHILASDKGEIVYSQSEKDFQTGETLNINLLDSLEKTDEIKENYYIFSQKSRQGWYTIAAIEKDVYNYEIIRWKTRVILFAAVSIFISLLLALVIWNAVYKPLKNINGEIKLMAQSEFTSNVKETGISEFDDLLKQFQQMKIRIVELFREIEEKEHKKRVVEVEKLLHQINPHFLHNTLSTIQWMARMNGQKDIDQLVMLFTRVLHYNLGKEGAMVLLSEEIDTLKDYLELQRMRYDNTLDVKINIADDTLDEQIPRFILQPIVENALYHGLLGEDGEIEISAEKKGQRLVVTIRDNGVGMSEKEINGLLAGKRDENQKGGIGIGLNYVKEILDVYYDGKAYLDIESKIDFGTVFTLNLCVSKNDEKEAPYDKNPCCG